MARHSSQTNSSKLFSRLQMRKAKEAHQQVQRVGNHHGGRETEQQIASFSERVLL